MSQDIITTRRGLKKGVYVYADVQQRPTQERSTRVPQGQRRPYQRPASFAARHTGDDNIHTEPVRRPLYLPDVDVAEAEGYQDPQPPRTPRPSQPPRQRQQGQQQQPTTPRRGPGFWILVGMFACLFMWTIIVHVTAWYVNSFSDPTRYTQTSHLDVTTVTDAQGHQAQARAFIDPENHIDLLLIPDNDPGKSRIIVGPSVTQISDPQHNATVTTTSHGSVITINIQGPLVAGLLSTERPGMSWSVDLQKEGK